MMLPMANPIPLPIEKWTRVLGVRLADHLRGCLPRRWRENPLLLREAGLREGQTIWRSPFALMLILLLAYLAVCRVLSIQIHRWEFPQGPTWFHWLYGFDLRVLSQLVFVIPVYLTARSWARERHPSQRDQLTASPLTIRQLVEAKTLLWLIPLLSFHLLHHVYAEGESFVRALWHKGGIVGFFSEYAVTMGNPLLNSLCRWGWSLFHGSLWTAAAAFFTLGLATRLTLIWWSPVLSTALLWGASHFYAHTGYRVISALYEMLHPFHSPPYTSTDFLVWYLLRLVTLAVWIALAVAVWWRLPRHVARVYGLDQR